MKIFEELSRNTKRISYGAKITISPKVYLTNPSQSALDVPNDNDKVELGSTPTERRSKRVFLSGCRF